MDNKLTKKENFWQAAKFVLFSISAGVIQLVSFTLLNELIIKDIGNKYGWSYFIALTLSVIWNFTLNREFTFKSANNVPIAMLKVLGFYLVFTPLSIWWGIALEKCGWNEYLILLPTMVINMVLEFLFCRFFVYGKSINTNKRASKANEVEKENNLDQDNKTTNQASENNEESLNNNEIEKTNNKTEKSNKEKATTKKTKTVKKAE